MTTEEILAKEDVKYFDKDIRAMDYAELKEHFGAASSGNIIVKRVIKNIVWQVYEKITIGEEKVEGNLRSFFANTQAIRDDLAHIK